MHRKDILHIIDKRFELLHRHLDGIHQLDIDALHDWRVEVKRLRAFLRLLSNQHKKIKLSASLKELYLNAGYVRDRQVQTDRVKRSLKQDKVSPNTYFQLLNAEISETGSKVKVATENDALLQIEHYRIISLLPSKLARGKIESFLQEQLFAIRNILWLTYKKDEYLHECRKHIKDLQYVIEILDKSMIDKLKIDGMPSAEELKTAAHSLGEFNDLCVSLRFFSSSYLNRLPVPEKKLLSVMRDDTRKEKLKMKAQLLRTLETSFQHLLHLHAS